MKKNTLLTKAEIKKGLTALGDWQTNPKQTFLYKTFAFPKHVDALIFIARITVHAEVQQHHPDIEFSHAKVKVKLSTHDAKGLTTKDVQLARKIQELGDR